MRKISILLMFVFVSLFIIKPIFADPPAESGIVMRGEMVRLVYYTDEDTGLVAFQGLDVVRFTDLICNRSSLPPDIWEWQGIDYDEALELFRQSKVKGDDIAIIIYPIEIWNYPDTCEYIAANAPIAVGTVDAIGRDNGRGTFTFSAHGVLYDPDESEYRMNFNGGFHIANGEFKWGRVQLN